MRELPEGMTYDGEVFFSSCREVQRRGVAPTITVSVSEFRHALNMVRERMEYARLHLVGAGTVLQGMEASLGQKTQGESTMSLAAISELLKHLEEANGSISMAAKITES